ncbi:MAG: hypothetical protein AVDCRST_MAG76-1258, partial [uncultured Acidimicrobiales bacterium]
GRRGHHERRQPPVLPVRRLPGGRRSCLRRSPDHSRRV